MKVVQVQAFNDFGQIKVVDKPSPVLNPSGVRVQVKACGVTFVDWLLSKGAYQIKPSLPFTPGSEVSGIVTEVGDQVKNFKMGDAVFGLVMTGGLAEELIADEASLIPKPEGISHEQAAAFLVNYTTAYYALKTRAQAKPSDTMVVLGAAGGLGLAAVDLGKILCGRVIACASSEEKLKTCKEYGATDTLVYNKETLKDDIKRLTGGKGADIIFDPVGGDFSEQALRATNRDGRFLVLGFASGEIPSVKLNLPLLKSCQIIGVDMRAFMEQEPKANAQHIKEVTAMLLEGKISPHVNKPYALTDIVQLFTDISERKTVGKTVVSM